MFEVLNNRGKPLSELEKLKNYLLYLANKLHNVELHQKTNRIWSLVFTTLMARQLDEEEDKLFQIYWQAYRGTKALNTKVFNAFKELFPVNYDQEFDSYPAKLDAYLSDLERSLEFFVDLNSPNNAFTKYEERQELCTWSLRISRIRGCSATVSPLLLAVYLVGTTSEVIKAMKECERLGFLVYCIGDKRSDTAKGALISLANQVYVKAITIKKALKEVRKLADGHCTASKFQGFIKSDEVEFHKWGGITYFLYEYEYSLNPSITVDYNSTALTIEHILPQNPKPNEWSQFPMPEEYVHRLGNLTLTLENSALSNLDFVKKSKIYLKSTLLCEREIGESTQSWTPETVEGRQDKLFVWARTRWEVPQKKTKSKKRKSDVSTHSPNKKLEVE
jgi:hypothetical protein